MSESIDKAIQMIRKKYGPEAIQQLDGEALHDIEVIPSGSIGLDAAIGVGGVPKGRIIEAFGAESSGKTTLILTIMASAQKQGGDLAFIDTEHVFDPKYAKAIGIDVGKLKVAQPDTGEEALDIMETLVRSGSFSVVALDSVAALVPRAEVEGEIGDSHMALQARLMSQALRKLTSSIRTFNTCILFTNQVRSQFGQGFGWTPPETTSGGRALKFYASVRLEIKRIGSIKKGDRVVGSKTRVRVVKNKVAPPFRDAEFVIWFGKGIDRLREILELGIANELIEQSGAYYKIEGMEKAAHGEDATIKYLEENAEIAEKLEQAVRKKIL